MHTAVAAPAALDDRPQIQIVPRAGLPIAAVLIGFVVWFRRGSRWNWPPGSRKEIKKRGNK